MIPVKQDSGHDDTGDECEEDDYSWEEASFALQFAETAGQNILNRLLIFPDNDHSSF